MCQIEVINLANEIYPILLPYARRRGGAISYSGLCGRLPRRWAGLEPRSQLLASALGAIVERCRNASPPLPALSALVVHAGGDERPGNGYFVAAHPGIEDPLEREVAWAQEFDEVHQQCNNYPATFDEL